MTRPTMVALAVILTVVALASPARAHTRAELSTDWKSRIIDAPEIEGVSWRLYPAGEYLRLENLSDEAVVVFGYEDEPYLRIGPRGVEQNLNSPATYLNARRDGDVALPPRADAEASPQWAPVSTEPRYAWYDHRVHRMPSDPRGEGASWEVPFQVGAASIVLSGELRREATSVWWMWLGLGVALTAPAIAGVRRRRIEWMVKPATTTVTVVACLNLLHVPDEIVALPVSAVDMAYGVFHHLLFIGVGIAGCVIAVRRGMPSLLPLWAGSGAVAFHQGILQVQQLGASQLMTAWPPAMIQIAVAMSIAQFVWVTLTVWIARIRFTSHAELEIEQRAIALAAGGRSSGEAPRSRGKTDYPDRAGRPSPEDPPLASVNVDR